MSYATQTNRRTQSGGNPVSLFPFLAVLLCTMGTLIVVLMLFARQAQLSSETEVAELMEEKTGNTTESAAAVVPTAGKLGETPTQTPKSADVELAKQAEKLAAEQKKLADQIEEVAQQLGIEQWKLEQMQIECEEKAKKLQDSRIAMGSSQEERDKLLAELNRMREALVEMQKNGEGQETPAELERQIAEKEKQLKQLALEVEAAENTAKQKDGSYAILPHAGANGTRRYPIYIECRKDGAWLMPENIQLGARDFEGVLSMGNPLEAALMAKREYLRQNGVFQETPNNEQEPYPLIVVRPDGIVYLYMVRSALQSWKAEYGYELVQDDWKLAYPPNDTSLSERMMQAIAQARVRQEEIATMMPTLSELSNGSSSGNVAPAYRPTSQGPQAMNVEQDSRLARTLRNSNLEQRRLAAAAGDSPAAQEASTQGAFGANSGSGLASGTAPGNSLPGSALPGGAGGTAGGSAAGTAGGSGTLATNFGGTGLGTGSGTNSAFGGTEANGMTGASGTVGAGGIAGSNEQGGATGGSNMTGTLGSQGSSGTATSNGTVDHSSVSDVSQWNVTSDGSSATSGASGASTPGSAGGASSFDQYSTQRCIADVEGMNWALDQYRPSMTSLKRNVKMECRTDAYVLTGQGGDVKEVVIPLTSQGTAVRKLAENIRQRTRAWGEPGTGMYWKPVLVVHVAPGAETQFETLKAMLNNSGLEIETE